MLAQTMGEGGVVGLGSWGSGASLGVLWGSIGPTGATLGLVCRCKAQFELWRWILLWFKTEDRVCVSTRRLKVCNVVL